MCKAHSKVRCELTVTKVPKRLIKPKDWGAMFNFTWIRCISFALLMAFTLNLSVPLQKLQDFKIVYLKSLVYMYQLSLITFDDNFWKNTNGNHSFADNPYLVSNIKFPQTIFQDSSISFDHVCHDWWSNGQQVRKWITKSFGWSDIHRSHPTKPYNVARKHQLIILTSTATGYNMAYSLRRHITVGWNKNLIEDW